jgi:hypothetical protein
MTSAETIIRRQEKERAALVELLKEIPLIEPACKRAGISRSTYYRWQKEDAEFARVVVEAENQGIQRINDMSESQLIKLISEGKMPAIMQWLKAHHWRYAPDQRSRWNPRAEKSSREEPLRLGDNSEFDQEARRIAEKYEAELKQAIVNSIRRPQII